MARFAWTPVEAPNISATAIQAQQAAGQAINQAFGGLNSALAGWEGGRRQDALKDITRQQLSFSTPEELQAAIASGAINLESDYLTPDDMLKVSGYQDVLAGRQNTALQREIATKTFGRQELAWDRDDAKIKRMEAIMPAYQQLMANVGPTGLTDQQRAEFAGILTQNGITLDEFNDLQKSLNGQASSVREGEMFTRNARDSDTNRRQSDYTFSTTVNANDVKAEATNILNSVKAEIGNVTDPGAISEILSNFVAGKPFGRNAVAQVAAALGVSTPYGFEGRNDDIPTYDGPNGARAQAQTYGSSGNGRQAKGDRHNNTGNIEDVGQFVGVPGYLGNDGRFARFATPEAGQQAQYNQLARYMDGRTTGRALTNVNDIVMTWSPLSDKGNTREGMTNYVNYVARRLGVSPGERIPPARIPELAQAMGEWENGRAVRGSIAENPGTGAGGAAVAAGSRGGTPNSVTARAAVTPGSANFLSDVGVQVAGIQTSIARQTGTPGLAAAEKFAASQGIRELSPAISGAMGNGGVFANSGVDRGLLENAVQDLIKKVPGLSAGTAVNILAEANNPNKTFGNSQFALGNRGLGGGRRVNMNAAEDMARYLMSPQGRNSVAQVANLAAGRDQVTQLNTQITNLTQQVAASQKQDAERGVPASTATRSLETRLASAVNQAASLTALSNKVMDDFEAGRNPIREPERRTTSNSPVVRAGQVYADTVNRTFGITPTRRDAAPNEILGRPYRGAIGFDRGSAPTPPRRPAPPPRNSIFDVYARTFGLR